MYILNIYLKIELPEEYTLLYSLRLELEIGLLCSTLIGVLGLIIGIFLVIIGAMRTFERPQSSSYMIYRIIDHRYWFSYITVYLL